MDKLELKTSGAYPQAVAFIILAGMVTFLDIVPLFWHVKHKNFAAVSLTIWVILLNFFNFINGIIWRNDGFAHWWLGYGLCDIEVKIIVGAWCGMTGALACMLRNLARVMNTKNTQLAPSPAQKRGDLALNIILCWGVPALMMPLHYIVQPNRYWLVGIVGCIPSFDDSWPSDVLVLIWPAVLSLVDTYYALLLIYRIHRYRTEFSSLLRAHSTTKSRFLRLVGLSTALVVVFLPLQIYFLYLNLAAGSDIPYSWRRVHAWPARPPAFPSAGTVRWDHWIHIAVGAVVFAVFGLNREAAAMCRGWAERSGLGKLAGSLGLSRASLGSAFASTARLVRRSRGGKGDAEASAGSDTVFSGSGPRSSTQSEALGKESYDLPVYAKGTESAEAWSKEVRE